MTDSRQHLVDALVAEVVADAVAASSGPVDAEDLLQTAHLAVLEARTEAPHLDPVHDRTYLEWRIREAITAQLGSVPPAAVQVVSLGQLSGHDDVWDGDVGADVVARAAIADHVHGLLRTMPADTVQVVRLVFGLDGGAPIDPADVADVLDLDPEEIEGHLWVAERLFRHHAEDPRDRRQLPLTEREFQAFRSAGDLAWYDLRDLNLNNADLSRCDVSQTILSGMNLWGLKLIEARAAGINLWGSQLDGADLRGADLRLGYLERTSLCGADLQWADLSEANLWRADLSSANADHASFTGANLSGANLVGADLTGTDLSGADLRGANLNRARLGGADLSGADLEGAQIWRTDLRWADLSGANLCWLDLSVADLRGASLNGAVRSPKLAAVPTKRAPLPQRLRPLPVSA